VRRQDILVYSTTIAVKVGQSDQILQDEVHLPAGHHFSRLKVLALLRREKLASKQMHFASTVTLIDDRP